ncbi:MAG TPA: hypothetical protein VJ646_03125 [Candidatus Binatia bacterium]|nr:hypothetical protein [Candidatus Binatia bacterium]
MNVGVAAHITAAALRGPRYDSSLTCEERQHQSNGIWLCQTHAKLVDSDSEHFTVEMLRKWKQDTEKQSFRALVALPATRDQHITPAAPDTADHELIERLGLAAQDDLASVTLRLIRAAQTDLAAFKRMSGWPSHAIALNLKMTNGDSVRAFNVSALAAAIETFNKIVVIAPPGTGKTTTLLQVTEAILSQGNSVAAFVPLSEWSSQSDSFFQSVVHRHAFVGAREGHLKLLAHYDRIVLVMDGWNELDAASRKRASVEIKSLQREFPGLGIVVSTRRQALDVPISGPVVEIDALAEGQQLEIARALHGLRGEAILDHAWRTPGVRELVTIPLYLTALLSHAPGGTFPTTKEEVLRLFVTEHECAAYKADVLRETLFGFHKEMLTALAVEATRAANTTISDSRSRAVVKRVEDHLSAAGQITIAPQPTAVLDVLVSYHLLVRSDAKTGSLSFQHQQFQEWYASFEAETLMRAAASGDQKAKQKLKVDVLNLPAWEEPILFACERVSQIDQTGLQAVAASILETMTIDPLLAAEMIYRSSDSVWDKIKKKIIAFVGRWHASGKVDRAVHFMISTGRSEFAPQVWPLISDADSQVHLAALRAGRRFRPSVLGADVQACIAQLPEEARKHIVSEIASQSDMDGIELAARLAQTDASPKVQTSVIEALQFRRADRFVGEILRAAPDEVWCLLARKGYAEEIANPDATARLRRERQRYIEEETDPLRKLRVLLDATRHGVAQCPQIGTLIEAADFPAKEQDAGWIIHEAHKRYPDDVTSALLHRLEAGREIPFRAEGLLQAAGIVVDEGPLVDLVVHPNSSEKVAEAAVSIVGPETVRKLIDMLIVIDKKLRVSQERADEATREEYHRLEKWISKTRLISFVQAILSRSSTVEPGEIALLAELLARYGERDTKGPLQLDGEQYEQMITAVRRWAVILLASPAASRAQFAEVAQAIERLAAPELVPTLQRLLAEDLVRWRRARDESMAACASGEHIQSDACHSWTFQYRRAFAAIGDGQVVELIKAYLPDTEFGFDAACVLKAIWDRKRNSPEDKWFTSWPDFSKVKVQRLESRERGGEGDSSPFADAILAVVEDLMKSGSSDDAQRHALQLAKIAFSMPYGNRTDTIDMLLRLPRPLREKQKLLAVLVLAGEIIRADMVLDGIKTLLEEAKTKRWLLDENRGELEAWLELLPFSDRPEATLDALELLEPNLRQPWRLRRLLSALGHAPSPAAEHVLNLLPRKDARFLSEHDWFTALDRLGTVPAARMLLELICGQAFASRPGGMDTWTLSQKLAGAMRAHVDFRAEVYQRYERLPADSGKVILEHAIAEVADADGVLILVRSHAVQGKPFSSILHSAIRHAAVGERPSVDWAGANEVFSVPVPDLRKRLFAMTNDDTAETRLASACLTAIDELRDDYGPAESEPRHPDIDSGRPWPLVAF